MYNVLTVESCLVIWGRLIRMFFWYLFFNSCIFEINDRKPITYDNIETIYKYSDQSIFKLPKLELTDHHKICCSSVVSFPCIYRHYKTCTIQGWCRRTRTESYISDQFRDLHREKSRSDFLFVPSEYQPRSLRHISWELWWIKYYMNSFLSFVFRRCL